MKHFFLFLFISIISFSSYSQVDTLNIPETEIDSIELIDLVLEDLNEILADTVLFTNFNSNLDKMVDLWYVQKSEYWKYSNRPANALDTAFIPQCSTEEYKKRISKINTVIPLTYNDQVQAYINLYAFRKRKQVEIMLGLAEYYFPIFEEILEINNVPQELKYLSIIESALNPRATSPVGAGGLWQFMPGTGKMYKLYINSYVDDRRDPIKATYAAAKYLGALHSIFDDWLLALAAYNCGPGNVKKAIARSGGKRTFWEIYPYLPRETRGYVPAYIAAYYVFEYHAQHNLYPREVNFPPAVDTVMVTQKVHLQQVSEVLNIPLQLLLDINPQYKLGIIPENENGYALYLPIEYVTPFISFQDSIITYKDSIYFVDKTILKGTEQTKTDSISNTNSNSEIVLSGKKSQVYYYVKKGDNLSLIAEWYDVTVADVKRWNKMNGNSLHVGRKLMIYVPSEKREFYTGITRMSFSQKQKLASNSTASSTKTTSTSTTPKSKPKYVYHTVRSGDTLYAIAQKYNNVSIDDIKRLNGLHNASKITPGMKLKIRTM